MTGDSGTPRKYIADIIEAVRDLDDLVDAVCETYRLERTADKTRLDKMERELAAAQADANRYRWLREVNPTNLASVAWSQSREACKHGDPDAAIDAAMGKAGEQEKCSTTGVPVAFCTCSQCAVKRA